VGGGQLDTNAHVFPRMTCNLICLQPVNTGPSLIRSLETCQQPTDDNHDIAAAVTAPAEPASAAPSEEEEEEGGRLDLARPPRASTGYGDLRHFAALGLPAGRQ